MNVSYLKSKVYITKYWDTKGIFSLVCIVENGYACDVDKSHGWGVFKRSEYWFNFEDARSAAERLREKRIISMEKKLDEIRKLEFNED